MKRHNRKTLEFLVVHIRVVYIGNQYILLMYKLPRWIRHVCTLKLKIYVGFLSQSISHKTSKKKQNEIYNCHK
jgi:hypothetical protein